ncbi:MAG TPA: RNA ligase family protein [Bacillales bacterium]|nr:RNA ligase family protein [Bacillales bacterium]
MEPIIPFEPVRKDRIPSGEDWMTQVKWDGVRILVYRDGNEVRLFNRKKNERTMNYPELVDIRSFCKGSSVILDGEVIALGEDGKPSFHKVMRRDGIRREERVKYMKDVVPVSYMIFDVLFYNGDWLNQRPLIERMEILDEIIEPRENIQLVASHDDPHALFEAIRQQEMEGIVMKKRDSPYLIGEKKENWIKVKNYRDLIAAIGGFTLDGNVANAVLLGLYDREGRFHYAGHTGTGKMTGEDWRVLTEKLQRLKVDSCPFVNRPHRHKDAYWVRPVLTVKVQYAEWTQGRALRQPSIQALVDIPASECVMSSDRMRGAGD